MKLATQLLAAPALIAAVALGTGALQSALSLWQDAESAAKFESDLRSIQGVAQVQRDLAEVHASVYRTQAIINSVNEGQLKALRERAASQLGKARDHIDTLVPQAAGDAELGAALAQALAHLDAYRKQADKAIELSDVDVNLGVAAMRAAEQSFGELATVMQTVVARKDMLHAQYVQDSRQAQMRQMALLALLGLAATAGALWLAWTVQRRIVREVSQAATVAREVAAGNLTVQSESTRRDEIGELVRGIGAMAARLRESLQTVRTATDSISTASREIASGNNDLSQRTEQAAGSLQQTASAMEQLSGTVQQTAESARTASQLAASASTVAQRGGEVVGQVVATMQEIDAASRRIADIIGTIDGIAFQTNILALNAAVEAARAGEQGRGFAVVAGEVRSLAQRSAEAAREIKGLIQASVEKVSSGSRQVQDAGSTMTEIVASVQRVNDIIGEISAAATEQHGGVQQVNGTVAELDRSTQQNAALVEQSAAAAESLREQALRLAEVVGRFRLGEGGVNAAAAGAEPPSPPTAPPTSAPVRAPAAAAWPTDKAASAPAALAHAAVARAKAGAATPAPAKAPPADKALPVLTDAADDWESF